MARILAPRAVVNIIVLMAVVMPLTVVMVRIGTVIFPLPWIRGEIAPLDFRESLMALAFWCVTLAPSVLVGGVIHQAIVLRFPLSRAKRVLAAFSIPFTAIIWQLGVAEMWNIWIVIPACLGTMIYASLSRSVAPR
jgi:hypothetical protein